MSARLVVVQGVERGREFPLEGRVWDIGSGDGLDVSLPDPEVARIHCKIYLEGGNHTIFDLSGRGFLVNGKRTLKKALAAGDIFRVGSHSLRFVLEESRTQRPSAPVGRDTPADGVRRVELRAIKGNDAGKVYDLSAKDMYVMGRGGATDITIWDIKASRIHGRLDNDGGTFVLTDLDSSNGTLVNGERITAPHRLRDGDQIRIGACVLMFRDARG